MFAYPVFLDVTACRVLVVGAGAVAARKVRGLLEAGAGQIVVVAPAFAAEMPIGPDVTRITRGFEEGDLEGVGLCFAATDSAAVNEHVCDLCRKRGIPVNRADHEGGASSTFTVPAIARAQTGAITVAVSAGGSPAIAARVRDAVAEQVLPGWGEFAEAATGLRREILEGGEVVPAVRQAAFRTLASAEAQAAHARGGVTGLWEFLLERHPELGKK